MNVSERRSRSVKAKLCGGRGDWMRCKYAQLKSKLNSMIIVGINRWWKRGQTATESPISHAMNLPSVELEIISLQFVGLKLDGCDSAHRGRISSGFSQHMIKCPSDILFPTPNSAYCSTFCCSCARSSNMMTSNVFGKFISSIKFDSFFVSSHHSSWIFRTIPNSNVSSNRA